MDNININEKVRAFKKYSFIKDNLGIITIDYLQIPFILLVSNLWAQVNGQSIFFIYPF